MKIEVRFDVEVPDGSSYQDIQIWLDFKLGLREWITNDVLESFPSNIEAENVSFTEW